MCSVVFPRSDPHRPLQYSLNGLGLAVREILGEVGFGELMQRGAKGGAFTLRRLGRADTPGMSNIAARARHVMTAK